jgi:integrase
MRPSTRATVLSILKQHIEPMVAGLGLHEITVRHVQSLIGKLAAAGRKPATVRSVVRCLRVLLRAAEAEGYAARAFDLSALQFPSTQAPSAKLQTFTAEELRRLIAETSSPWNVVYALAAGLGLRCGEVLGIAWRDVDLERGTLTVRQAAVMGRIGPVKSKGSAAHLPLAPELVRLLRAYRETWTPNPEDLLFASRRGRPMHASAYRRRLTKDLKRLGLRHRGTHAFRHSAASLLLQQGIGLAAVRDLLRHADSRVTDRYSHSTSEDMKRGAEMLSPNTNRPTTNMRNP